MKLILIMLLALAPLGLIAILAAVESARANQSAREAGARVQAVAAARGIDALLARTALSLRAAGTALERRNFRQTACRRALQGLRASSDPSFTFAMFSSDGRRLCGNRGVAPPLTLRADTALLLDPDGRAVSIVARSVGGTLVGATRIPTPALAAVARPELTSGRYRLVLRQGAQETALGQADGALSNGALSIVTPLGDRRSSLELTVPRARLRVTEALSILLPMLMLVAAGVIAFLVTDRLMLRPLRQLQAAVLAYRGGDRRLAIPRVTSPAHEIRGLAAAFRSLTRVVARHEGELEEGLARQTRLTREVHHRVKNNLQVVASLLNLHARGAPSRDVADAYAAIQRRVDALAVVHRNHYAEMEENRGVALRPLLSELAANLRANAPPEAAAMPILLDLAPLSAVQDVAVPVAFIMTELVEAAMLRRPDSPVTITLAQAAPGRATLTVIGEALRASASATDATHGPRFERVLQGLSRQLRAALDRDEADGRVAIEIAVME